MDGKYQSAHQLQMIIHPSTHHHPPSIHNHPSPPIHPPITTHHPSITTHHHPSINSIQFSLFV